MFVRVCTPGFMVDGAYRNFKRRRIEDTRYGVVNVIRVVRGGGRSELVVHEREQGTYFAMRGRSTAMFTERALATLNVGIGL